MRLDTIRLLDSDFCALTTGDEFKAAVRLWCKAWAQSPAGSLPADDRVLAHLSGAGTRWQKVKTMALRGWVVCSDGRLYHPVVAEQVHAAWAEREEYRAEIDAQKQRKHRERAERSAIFEELKAAGITPAWNTPTGKLREMLSDCRSDQSHLSRTCHSDRSHQSHTCHGDSHGLDGTGRDGKSFKSITPDTPLRADTSLGVAGAMARSLREKGFPDCAETHPDLILLAGEGYTLEDLNEAANAGGGQKPISWIAARMRGRRRDAHQRASEGGSLPSPAAVAEVDALSRNAAEIRESFDRSARLIANDVRLGLIDQDEGERRMQAAIAARNTGLQALGFPSADS